MVFTAFNPFYIDSLKISKLFEEYVNICKNLDQIELLTY